MVNVDYWFDCEVKFGFEYLLIGVLCWDVWNVGMLVEIEINFMVYVMIDDFKFIRFCDCNDSVIDG